MNKIILFSWGKIDFYSHGVFLSLGIIIAGLLTWQLAKKHQLNSRWLADNLVYLILVGLIGGRLGYVLFYPQQITDFWQIFAVWEGGLVSWGAMAAGLIFACLSLIRQKNLSRWLDVLMVGFLFGLAVARVGGFLAGDVYGVTSNNIIAINNRLPVALIESIFTFGLGLWLLFRFNRFSEGMIFWTGLVGYGILRGLLGFWRVEGSWGTIKFDQIIAIIIIISSLTLLLRRAGKKR